MTTLASSILSDDERTALQRLIAEFRLPNWTDENGDSLPLVDVITTGYDIGPGLLNIELLADVIANFYAERVVQMSMLKT